MEGRIRKFEDISIEMVLFQEQKGKIMKHEQRDSEPSGTPPSTRMYNGSLRRRTEKEKGAERILDEISENSPNLVKSL